MDIEDLREKLEQYRLPVILVAGLLIVLSLALLVVGLVGGSGQATLGKKATVIYYDIDQQTIRLVEHDLATAQPASPLAGTENVFIASVWSCGDAPDARLSDGMSRKEIEDQGLFIAWLERDDPEAKPSDYVARPMLFRTLNQSAWQKGETPAAIDILESPFNKCADAKQFFVK